jgi:two-component system, NarL family, sensor kinase
LLELRQAKDTTRAKVLVELCWEFRFRNADTARHYGLQGLALAQELKNKKLMGDALLNIGISYEAQGDYPKALEYELQALAIWQALDSPLQKAKTLNNLGIIYDEIGDQRKALQHYFEALAIFEERNLPAKIAGTVMNIGIVMKAQKEYTKAIEYYRRSGKLFRELANKFGEGACYANLGSCYLHLGSYDSALYYSTLGASFFEKLNIQQSLPTTWTNAAIALDTLKRYTEAKAFLIKARRAHQTFGAKKELAYNLIQLARLYQKMNKPDSAIKTIEEAILTTRQAQVPEQVMQAYQALAYIESKQNNYKRAYAAQLQYSTVKDSLFQSDKRKQVLELEQKYETEKKVLLLAEQELKLERNQWLIVLLTTLVVLIVALVFVWRRSVLSNQQRQLAEKQREFQSRLAEAAIALQEKERARVAKDLHDGFGQYISTVQLYVAQTQEHWKQNATDLLNQMHREVRNIAFDLLPHTLASVGLVAALRELASRITQSRTVTVQLHMSEAGERLENGLEVSLYRVCQEWINNILKYSHATVININAVRHDAEFSLILEDNGDGFDKTLLEKSVGNGWRNIQLRIQLHQGTVFVESTPGRKGNMLIIEIPIASANLQVA